MVGMIHKRMSSYVHTLFLIGTLLTPTIIQSASESPAQSAQSKANAKRLMDIMYDSHLHNLLRAAEYLHQILCLEPQTLSDGIQKINNPNDQKQARENCAQLAATVNNLRTRCKELLKNNNHDNVAIWEVAAGLLRLYHATHDGLQNNFSKEWSDSEVQPTAHDTQTLQLLKEFEDVGKACEKALTQCLPGDKTHLNKLLMQLLGESDFKKLGQPSFSMEQQITLQKILTFKNSLKKTKSEIDDSMKVFGLTWRERQWRAFNEQSSVFSNKFYTEPIFRLAVIGGVLGTLALGASGVAIGVYKYTIAATAKTGAALALASAKTIGEYALVGTGQRAGNLLTDQVVETVGDVYTGIIEYTGKAGKVGGYDNRIGKTKNGCIIRRIIPHESTYEDAIIDDENNECAEALALADDMIEACVTKSTEERTLLLTNRTKTFIYEGPTGAGKTFYTNYIMNECAKRARMYGIEVYEVFLTPASIEHNEMEAILQWAHGKNVMIIFNFDEFQHAKPSQKENAKAYGNLLNFFQKLSESGHPYIGLGTTNQLEIESDLMRALRIVLKHIGYPSWNKRKKFFKVNFTNILYGSYNESTLNRFATLAQGANMAQLREILSTLKAKKGLTTDIPIHVIEEEIVHKIHGIHHKPGQNFDVATATHVGGQLIISLATLNHNSIIQGTSMAIASAIPCEKRDNPKALRPTIYPGQFIWTSATEENNDKQKLNNLIGGYVLQELMIKDPQKRNTVLIEKDRQAAKTCLLAGRDPQQMSKKERDDLFEEIRLTRAKIEDEVRAKFSKVPANLVHKTVEFIAQRGQMTALEYLALQKKLAEAEKQKAAEDAGNTTTQTGAARSSGIPHNQVIAAAATQKKK